MIRFEISDRVAYAAAPSCAGVVLSVRQSPWGRIDYCIRWEPAPGVEHPAIWCASYTLIRVADSQPVRAAHRAA